MATLVTLKGIPGEPSPYNQDFEIPLPSTYVGTTSTIVDSARNVQGVVVGQVVRADVGKVEMTWRYISAADWASILGQFAGANRFFRTVEFYNQDTNATTTRTMYVSDRSTGGVFLLNPNGSVKGWVDAKFSLVEK